MKSFWSAPAERSRTALLGECDEPFITIQSGVALRATALKNRSLPVAVLQLTFESS